MNYNKKQQPFTIIGRFRIFEEGRLVDYCRIKFHNTGFVTNIQNGTVKDLDFEDTSIVEQETIQTPVKEKQEIILDVTVPAEEFVESSETAVEATPKPTIKAISPDGEEIIVEDLEAFVAEYKLDMEAVESVLAGKQKTHRKWRFTTV
ncbi:hypothetical protein [Viridibacillus arvi]|uniref:hypothetical protein n=1 Tax=Viridibacillus arvi TaxID=263475 RepID=UPI0034CFA00E